jgi:hypothetical protein
MRAQFELALIAVYTGLSTWLPDAYYSYKINGGTAVTGSLFGTGGTAPDYTVPRNGVGFGDVQLAAGDLFEIEFMAIVGASRTMNWSAHQARLTIIKR